MPADNVHDRTVNATPIPDDTNPLRPDSLDSFAGQPILRERLTIAIESAKARGAACDHLLFSGPAGLGKTSIAAIVATSMGGQLVTTSGPALTKPFQLVSILTGLLPNAVLFVDEIHALPRVVEEFLYPAMEDFVVDIVTDKRSQISMRLPLPPFTLIGATTRKGKLTAPLRNRFGLDIVLTFYTPDELACIVVRSAGLLQMTITPDAALHVAKASRGTPRIANRLLRRVRDYSLVRMGHLDITLDVCEQALALEGIDNAGLDEVDRRYLHTLLDDYNGGPAGIAAIASTMQVEPDALLDIVEPYLLDQKFVIRTGGGRCLTRKGQLHIENN